MHLVVVGISAQKQNLLYREHVERIASSLRFSNIITLSTCNRVEFYFASKTPESEVKALFLKLERSGIPEIQKEAYVLYDLEALRHLSRVASGLDSSIIGETHIQNQVKQAYENFVQTHDKVPKLLHFAFQKALKIAKGVRHKFPDLLSTSIAPTILSLGIDFFKNEELPEPLFIGASKINKSLATVFSEKSIKRISLTNRTLEHGLKWNREYTLNLIPWEDMQKKYTEYRWIISAVKAPEILIEDVSDVPRLFIDLSVPRTIAKPRAGTLYTIDDITNYWKQKNESPETIQEAESHVACESHKTFLSFTGGKFTLIGV